MSLLLDALKRAEQEKQLSRGERDANTAREPVITPAAANAPSVASRELQPLHGAAGATPPSPQAAPAPRSEAAAHAAQAMFQAKQAPLEAEHRNRGMVIWATIGVIVVVAASAAAYVWSQIKQLSPRTPAAAYSAKRPPSAPVPEPASAATHVESPPVPLPAPAPLDPPHAPLPPPSPREALGKELLEAPAPAAAPRPPVAMAPSVRTPRIPAEVSSGYEALRTGDLATARRQYQAALAVDPRNLDALLGLATTEARDLNRPAAIGHYRRALEVDPRNATALAGLAALADQGRGESLEPQLLADIQRYPAQPALRVALGNVYAAQGRWSDAQAAYFEAHRLDPANADVAFNLAVALDQLGKSKLAATFYRRALEAARGQPAQFDPAAATRRAQELEALPER